MFCVFDIRYFHAHYGGQNNGKVIDKILHRDFVLVYVNILKQTSELTKNNLKHWIDIKSTFSSKENQIIISIPVRVNYIEAEFNNG